LQQALANTAVKTIIKTSVGDMLGLLKGTLTNLVIRHVKKLVPAHSLPNTFSFKHVLKTGRNLPYQRPELSGSDLALLQYTGGTTGVAKGAMLTHSNMVANVCQAQAWVNPYLQGSRELILTALPLYHIFALTANCLMFMKLGASNLLILNPRDIPALVKSLAQHK